MLQDVISVNVGKRDGASKHLGAQEKRATRRIDVLSIDDVNKSK
jgi:hypothetical protein